MLSGISDDMAVDGIVVVSEFFSKPVSLSWYGSVVFVNCASKLTGELCCVFTTGLSFLWSSPLQDVNSQSEATHPIAAQIATRSDPKLIFFFPGILILFLISRQGEILFASQTIGTQNSFNVCEGKRKL